MTRFPVHSIYFTAPAASYYRGCRPRSQFSVQGRDSTGLQQTTITGVVALQIPNTYGLIVRSGRLFCFHVRLGAGHRCRRQPCANRMLSSPNISPKLVGAICEACLNAEGMSPIVHAPHDFQRSQPPDSNSFHEDTPVFLAWATLFDTK